MIDVKTRIVTVKFLALDYRKNNNEMITIARAEEVEGLINNISDVNNITNNLIAKLGYEEALNKKKLDLQKSEKLEATKVEKFSGQGKNRFLK